MSDCASLVWYDYETFGVDPRRDRPVQFAAVRTDPDLNPIGEPLVLFCQPPRDYLPHPDACMLTGITPQQALRKGLPEALFIRRINEMFSVPGTCVAGYNNLRFDDEVTRATLYRNLLDPYAREWRNGNSRWDLIDVVRLAHAVRPEGINWPKNDEGITTFRLEKLTSVNNLTHDEAHDALSDVYATIELARLLRERQPKLFHWLFAHRGKAEASRLLAYGSGAPVLHVSEKYSAARSCLAVVLPVARHPTNPNGVVVYDLAEDPDPLLKLPVDELRRRLFTRVADLEPDEQRLALKTVHLNKCPVLAPLTVLDRDSQARLGIDLSACGQVRDRLLAASGLSAKISAVLTSEVGMDNRDDDPDLQIYSGGFLGDPDRRTLDRLTALPPEQFAGVSPAFIDPRLPEMWFRYRARNFPTFLSAAEVDRWEAFRIARLTRSDGRGFLTRDEYAARLRELGARRELTAPDQDVIASLWAYLNDLLP